MSESTMTTVRHSVVVDAPIELAFTTFTEDMGSWWPAEHHIIGVPLKEMVFEPRVGGRIYDLGEDGTECQWSRVLAYEPPDRIVISWDIKPTFELEPDHTKASEIEVRFTAEGDARTRVDLEHRGIERHGGGWENLREAVESEGGWPLSLANFAARLGT